MIIFGKKLDKCFGHSVGELNVFFYGELFWTEIENGVGKERMVLAKDLFHSVAHHLATHREDGFHDTTEKFFIAAQFFLAIS